MRWGITSLALAGALAWTLLTVHAGQVAKVCERRHPAPGGIVTVQETRQYVIGTSSSCPEPDVLSPLPSARIFNPAPEVVSSLLQAAKSVPLVLPVQQPVGSPPGVRRVESFNAGCVPGVDVRHETAWFESSSSVVRPQDERKLHELASGAVQYLRVEGYTDPHGSRALNERLAHDRAAAVAALLAKGSSRAPAIETVGSPSCCYQQDDAASRRVEVTAVIAQPCGPREAEPTIGGKPIEPATVMGKGGPVTK